MHKNPRLILALGLTAIAGASCASEVETVPEAQLAQQQLAVVHIDGAEVQFLEQRKGFPFVLAYSEPGQNPLADLSLEGLNVVELYERLTGEAAPLALEQALEREYEAASELALPGEFEADPDLEPAASDWTQKLSADDFRAIHCPGQELCMTSRTGTGEFQRYTSAVHGWVNPYRGEVSLQVRVRFITGWQNVATADVPQDRELHYFTDYVIARDQKVKVHNADGDGYHWAHGWN